MSRIVVVSNRVAAPDGVGAPGGLTVAVQSALHRVEALWFGWSGTCAPSFTGEVSFGRVGGIELALLDLEEADFDEYYNGFANATLWPVFHARTDLAAYDRSFGEGYERVNRRFAKALAPLVNEGDLIWVHDYHLIPLARELRRLGVRNPIGFFLHIPWPAPQLFTTLPQHRGLVGAMFDYDLVGMQTDEHVEAFEAYVSGELGGWRDGERLGLGERTIRIGAFPVGLDIEPFAAVARSAVADRTWERMSAHGAFRSLIAGVDRLDYSKGLPERLLGFERYLVDHPDMVRKVLYLQVAPSSRGSVEAYQALRSQVLALAGRINATFADMDHAPVLCVNRNYARAELAGIYRASRVGLVTPLRDGMNLVAKEYVAAQDPADPGVLVLSRFAGAAHQMRDALIVNPYCREEVSEALHCAVSMPLAERRRRWQTLMNGVVRADARAWRDDFISALRASGERQSRAGEARRWTALLGQTLGQAPRRDHRPLAVAGAARPTPRTAATG